MRSVVIGALCVSFIVVAAPSRAAAVEACTAIATAAAPFDVSFAEGADAGGDGALSQRPWQHAFEAAAPEAVPGAAPALLNGVVAMAQKAPAPRPRAVQMGKGYELRLKVHRLASWATVPLFVAQYVVGQKLYDGDSTGEGARDAHGMLATGTTVLFGVNTATGLWNLWDMRKKPEGRTRRIIHTVLMLGADAGFVATGMMAPDDDDGGGNRSGHRNLAIASMSVATASYLYMLFTR